MASPILITGSSGRIGSALSAALTGVGRLARGVDIAAGAATDHTADLAVDDLGSILDGCSTVVHCAALHAPHVGVATTEAFVAANVTATERLLAEARNAGAHRFVFLSSTSVYGNAYESDREAAWVDEDLAPEPRDIYDTTKLDAEAAVGAAHCESMTTITLRVARCFPEPPRDNVVNRLYRGLDLRDTIVAITAALDVDLDAHHVLNVAGPRVFDRSDCGDLKADAAASIVNRLPWLPKEFAGRGWSLPPTIDRVYVSDRARDVLGYEALHGVRSALAEV